jgi:hypothetical protein
MAVPGGGGSGGRSRTSGAGFPGGSARTGPGPTRALMNQLAELVGHDRVKLVFAPRLDS